LHLRRRSWLLPCVWAASRDARYLVSCVVGAPSRGARAGAGTEQPDAVAHMRRAQALATFEPALYEVVLTHHA
jgi:hypothetical protein